MWGINEPNWISTKTMVQELEIKPFNLGYSWQVSLKSLPKQRKTDSSSNSDKDTGRVVHEPSLKSNGSVPFRFSEHFSITLICFGLLSWIAVWSNLSHVKFKYYAIQSETTKYMKFTIENCWAWEKYFQKYSRNTVFEIQ